MTTPHPSLESVSDDVLLTSTRGLVLRSLSVTAELLVYLGEVDARKLYLVRACSSMFAYCVGELGFSEDAAYNRIAVARLARRLPIVLDFLRSGRVHLAALRLLAPHLSEDNHLTLLEEATGQSKRQVEELVARLSPKPPIPDSIRKLPSFHSSAEQESRPARESDVLALQLGSGGPPEESAALAPQRQPCTPLTQAPVPLQTRSSEVEPLAAEAFKVQFTASRVLRDKLRQAQELLGHGAPALADIVERALDLLIADVKKKRFGVGRKPRTSSAAAAPGSAPSEHVPNVIRRAVYERDGGHCTYVDGHGMRCKEARGLEFDHVDGFARTRTHSIEGIRLRCRAHNQHAAEEMYGSAFMEGARKRAYTTRPGTSGRG